MTTAKLRRYEAMLLADDELRQTQAALHDPARICVQWQQPGASTFEVITGANFFHQMRSAREAAFRHFIDQTSWRAIPLHADGDDDVLRQLAVECQRRIDASVDGFKAAVAKQVKADKKPQPDPLTREAIIGRLRSEGVPRFALHVALAAWAARPGDETAFDQVLDAVEVYVDAMYDGKGQLFHAPLGKVNPTWIEDTRLLRSFMEFGLRLPTRQRQVLTLRAGLQAYGTYLHFGRSFLSEFQKGTNDVAYVSGAFVKNAWRVAEAMDDPLAWDASRSHYDNHFRYSGSSDVAYSGREGMYMDGGYAFHSVNGRQFCPGGYGSHWLNGVINARHLGTPWGNTREQYRRLVNYQLKGDWLYHRWNRSLYRNGRYVGLKHNGVENINYAARLLSLPREALHDDWRRQLSEMIARRWRGVGPEGNYFFHSFLLMQHQRRDYRIETKLSSRIIGPAETFSGRQPANLFLADGVTLLMRDGNEYDGIFAAGNYVPQCLFIHTALPGTTQLNYYGGADDPGREIGNYGRDAGGDYAGGVSDGRFGNCSFDFVSHRMTGTTAKKLYAFTEDGMAVLATDVDGSIPASHDHYSYRSNLNQCDFTHPVTIVTQDGWSASIAPDHGDRLVKLPLNQRYWVQHRGIGYLVLPTGHEQGPEREGSLCVRTVVRDAVNRLPEDVWEKRSKDAFYNNSLKQAGERKVPVLDIWVDHGKQPTDAQCAYFVCMRPEKREPADWLADPPVEILANTASIMALRDCVDGVTHASFRAPGLLKVGERRIVATDQPCALMLSPSEDDGVDVYVQDAKAGTTYDVTQMADEIRVTVYHGAHERTEAFEMSGSGTSDARYRGATEHKRIRF